MIWTFLTFIVNHIFWLYIQDSEFSSSYNNMIFKYLNRFFTKLFHTNFFTEKQRKKTRKGKGEKGKGWKRKYTGMCCMFLELIWYLLPLWPGNSLGLGLYLVLPFICELWFLEKVDVPAVTRLRINIVLSFVGYCFQSILVKQRWCRTLASH